MEHQTTFSEEVNALMCFGFDLLCDEPFGFSVIIPAKTMSEDEKKYFNSPEHSLAKIRLND